MGLAYSQYVLFRHLLYPNFVCASRCLARRSGPKRCVTALALEVSVQISSACSTHVRFGTNFFTQLLSTHPSVIAFASASAELNEFCWFQSQSTTTCIIFLFSLHAKPNTHVVLPCNTLQRASTTTCVVCSCSSAHPELITHFGLRFRPRARSLFLQNLHHWDRGVPHHFFLLRMLCHIASRSFAGTAIEPLNGGLGGYLHPSSHCLLLFLPHLLLCFRVFTFAFAWAFPGFSRTESKNRLSNSKCHGMHHL